MIRQLSRERAGQIGRRAFDEMVDTFYAEDAQILPSGAAAVRGRDDIRRFWRSRPEEGLVSLTLGSREIDLSGTLAFEIGRFSATLRPRHGAPFQDHGKYIVIYRREPEGFRAIADMFNSDARR
jgi:ketosteroid isomerase-like protein